MTRVFACVVLGLVSLVGAHDALASDYVGMWKIDMEGEGIAYSFPDNGFSGACVHLSNNGEPEGHVRLESQLVRHRFDRVAMSAKGFLDPANVHVQVTVKGKTQWTADLFEFEEGPMEFDLDGHEFAIEAMKLAPSQAEWSVSLCGMELANDTFTVRFTSDCAGFDFDHKGGPLRIVVDEDWYALKRPLAGGLGVFGLGEAWHGGSQGEISLEAFTSYPAQLFYVALAANELPLLEPEEGEMKVLKLSPAEAEGLQFVVKAKSEVVGQLEWYARLLVHETSTVENAVEESADVVTSPESAETVEPEVASGNKNDGGCSVGTTGCPRAALVLLLVLLAVFSLAMMPKHSKDDVDENLPHAE